MHYSIGVSLAALFAAVANAVPQGVTAVISPSSPAPTGCSTSVSGTFEITVAAISSSKVKRQSTTGGDLVLTLNNGVLLDQSGRTGYIASNYQFQFDKPPQTGAIYTAGFSVCGNGSLALGGSAIWYSCASGGFSNLYDTNWAPQCQPIYIVTTSSSGSSSGSSASGAASEASEGQPQATSTITEASEGQPRATSVSQRTDGQPIATAPVSEASEGQPRVTSTAGAVSEASEGQPRATSTASAAVSEASEGQPRVTSTAAAVSEASEGQPRVTSTSTAPAVSEASEGQPRATGNATVSASPSPQQFTGLAVPLRAADAMFALAAAAAVAVF